jgi:peptidyl-prolyl cis-trans isomerase B (cyclophilin B)
MNPIARLEMANGDVMRIELYPEIAPITVENFSALVEKGFYNGLTFHRVIKGFMLQGGCPDGTGMGGPGHQIKGEFRINGVPNDLSHTTGVISMARSQSVNSAGSQFFIMHKDSAHLNGAYAAFGKVIEGLDVVEKMGNVATNMGDKPLEPLVIKEITMESNA